MVKSDLEGSVDQSGNGARVSSLIIQPDGKIVAAGTSYRGPALVNDFALARYNSDGTLDETFGTFGKVVQDFGGDDRLKEIVLQSDGKLVAAGSTYVGGNGDVVLVRYDADGSLDPAFGTAGVVVIDLGGNDSATGLGLQSGGKIVVAGVSSSIGGFVARYNPDGTLDSTFGSNGFVLGICGRLAIQANDKIVIVRGSEDFFVSRYNANGTLDTTFGTGGTVRTDFDGGLDSAESLAIQPDGKIIVAGWRMAPGYYYDFALARYNPSGSLDATFGTGGKVTTDLGGPSGSAYAVAILPDGKVVAAGGVSYSGSSNGGSDFALVRYNGDGTLDTTFGVGGKAFTDLGNTRDWSYALVTQPDAKIVAAGCSGPDFALARYLP